MKTYFESHPMKIGLHEWRLCIRDFDIFGTVHVCTEYQWRRDGSGWRRSREWPTYDHNDTYDGLPRSLSRLYEENRWAVDKFIHGREPAQGTLF